MKTKQKPPTSWCSTGRPVSSSLSLSTDSAQPSRSRPTFYLPTTYLFELWYISLPRRAHACRNQIANTHQNSTTRNGATPVSPSKTNERGHEGLRYGMRDLHRRQTNIHTTHTKPLGAPLARAPSTKQNGKPQNLLPLLKKKPKPTSAHTSQTPPPSRDTPTTKNLHSPKARGRCRFRRSAYPLLAMFKGG